MRLLRLGHDGDDGGDEARVAILFGSSLLSFCLPLSLFRFIFCSACSCGFMRVFWRGGLSLFERWFKRVRVTYRSGFGIATGGGWIGRVAIAFEVRRCQGQESREVPCFSWNNLTRGIIITGRNTEAG